MTERGCHMHATTLQFMQFWHKMALGISKSFYQRSNESPVHGSGQGSCASPALWLLISSILMDCLTSAAIGLSIQDVNKLTIIKQWIEGFVDDTSLFTSLEPHESNLCKLVANLNHDTQLWAELLEATGGKLELSKCFYCVLQWKFNDFGEPIPTTISKQRNTTNPITIIDH